MTDLATIKELAKMKLVEIDIKPNDPLFNFAVEVWSNGYIEAENDQKRKDDYTNMIEDKINKLWKGQ